MAHTIRDKKKLLDRVRRIRGQVEAIERALDQEQESTSILHTIGACRGALDSLRGEVLEGHIRLHVLDPERQPTDEQGHAVEELVAVVRRYLK